jgi:hypothetical protein
VPHAVRIAGTEDFEPGPGSGRTERFTDLIPKLGKVWSQQGSGSRIKGGEPAAAVDPISERREHIA